MKALVLFEESSGRIISMMHPPGQKETRKDAPVFGFEPSSGTRVESLEIPKDLQHLKGTKLHEKLKVDVSKGQPRLVGR